MNGSNNNNSVGENKAGTMQNDTVKLSMSVNQVIIWCVFFGHSSDKSFILYLSDLEVKKVDFYNQKDITVFNAIDIKNELIYYVNKFYIDKTENIVLSKKKRGYVISADYPYIEVTGFHNKKEIFKDKISIGNAMYDIDYNSEFLNFYELLKSIL
jgi:hypothetical protein